MHALVVAVGDERYAIETTRVREVTAPGRITRLPGAPGWVMGVINLRGEVIPLLDTAALLGLGEMPSTDFAAVVDLALGPAALASTAMPTVVTLGQAVGKSELPGALDRHRVDGHLVVLVDPEALVLGARGDATTISGGGR